MFNKNIQKLAALKENTYFTLAQLARIMNLSTNSAGVFASRHSKTGELLRLKRNFYTLPQKWERNTSENFFSAANILQTPSYVSLLTALAYYNVSTQVQQNFFESICLKRTGQYSIKDAVFTFTKMQKQFYSNFIKTEQFFIATKEKAFLDAVYLYSFGKYKIDFISLNLALLDIKQLKKMLALYPSKTKRLVKKLCLNL